jgi:import inner membrane translocase subunit TIM44
LNEVKPYRRPEKLRKRSEIDENEAKKVYESNTEATGVVLHKDSKWYQSWQNFKENNTYVNSKFSVFYFYLKRISEFYIVLSI